MANFATTDHIGYPSRMTEYQFWAAIGAGAAFIVNLIGFIAALIRNNSTVRQNIVDQITAERIARMTELQLAIQAVETKINEAALWNRDHFVQKPELNAIVEFLRGELRMLGVMVKEVQADIKQDFRELKADILNKREV